MQSKCCVVQVFPGEPRRFKGEKGDMKWDFLVQPAYVTSMAPFPIDIEIQVPEGQPPYAPGYYLLGAGCLSKSAIPVSNGQKARIKIQFEGGAPLVPLADALVELQGIAKSLPAPASAAVRAAS